MTILVVDDEQDLLEMIAYNLRKEGFDVLAARTGTEAVQMASSCPDLILLDIMIPEPNGLDVLRQLRADSRTAVIPVIFLTAKTSDVDEVLGLELGADDYIMKPVSMARLVARVRHVLRSRSRTAAPAAEPIRFGTLEIFPAEHRVRVDGSVVHFPRKEFALLLYLARHAKKVVGRETLLKDVWGSDVLVVSRSVDVHIRKIREKLGRYADLIETITGVGYRMREADIPAGNLTIS